MESEPSQEKALEQIRTLVAEAVARFGLAGTVVIEGDAVYLKGHGLDARADLGTLSTQWAALPDDAQRRRATDLARTLAAARRASLAGPPASPTRSTSGVLVPALGALAVLGAAVLAYRAFGPQPDDSDEISRTPVVASGAVDDAEARAARVCEATRSRIMRGATAGTTDVEGWVVELRLLRDGVSHDLTFDPALTAFVDRSPGSRVGTLSWPSSPSITSASGPTTRVEVEDASVPSATAPEWRGVRLTFTGRYVVPYFDEQQRIEYVTLANALAERLGATHGALYARCAASAMHHVGVWFLGNNPGAAVTSMLYFMGTYSDIPHLAGATLGAREEMPIDRVLAFKRVAEATRTLERDGIRSMLGPTGGGITGKDKGRSTLVFPYRDSNRASRASREIARQLGIGSER